MKIKAEKEERVVKLFGSISRARILGFLYAHEGRTFYQREIIYQTGLSLRPVQREMNNLVWLGIVKKQTTRTRVYYGINPDSSFFEPLKAIYGSSAYAGDHGLGRGGMRNSR